MTQTPQGEHQHATSQTPPVSTVIDTGDELTQPIIDHTEKITRIEERQAQHQEEMMRQLASLEERLMNASSGQVEGLRTRIGELEAKIESAPPEAPIPESVTLTLPDVETSPAPPERERHGLRHRRAARRKRK